MVLGLTGGVGCGKSTVMSLLAREYGAKLLIADELGHRALQPGTKSYERIREQFGKEYIKENGEIDRERLAALIYAREEKRILLNRIVHPYVFEQIEIKLKQWKEEPLVALETAILFETGCDRFCDEVWWVDAEREVRIQRLMASRGYSREKAEGIMDAQLGEDIWRKRCRYRIDNNGGEENLCRQLKELLPTT